MLRRLSPVLAILVVGCATASARPPAGDAFADLLDAGAIGASGFRKAHPEWDGRGAIIAVLDTGVDMGAPGLAQTSEGKPKVLAVRDFSGQGVLATNPVEAVTEAGETVYRADDLVVRGLGTLPAPEGDWSVAVLREAALRTGDVTDLNGDGRDDDSFGIAVARHDGRLSAWVDTDGNLDFTGALRVEDYAVKQQSFTLRSSDPRSPAPITLALHLDDDGTSVEVHFDDGGHGTHVAGIAAGYGLLGRAGFDGVAPGAQVLSLKIGDNTLAGGATTSDSMRRALEYAGEWSQAHNVTVVANISYGIGSEDEGRSDMDGAVDELMARYPRLVVSVSAGNEGPGLSTVGVPAGATLATSVAAMLPRGAAEVLFASRIPRDQLFWFSSRGGDSGKPDIAAPGIAAASTPPWDDVDIKAGTSMAAPMISGAYALLASAARATTTRVSSASLKRALVASARPLEGYGPVDQGAGVPSVERAWPLVRRLAEHDEPFRVAGYRVSTAVATSPSGESPAAYFRAGTWLPDPDEGQTFTIEPLLYETADRTQSALALVDFEADAAWLEPGQRRLRFKGSGSENLVVYYSLADRSPGVQTGRIAGTPDDGGDVPAFFLWTTVVTPHRLGPSDDYRLHERVTLEPGELARYPILVPPGATSLSVDVSPGDFCNAWFSVYDPAGRQLPLEHGFVNSQGRMRGKLLLGGAQLVPGIWELAVSAAPRGPRDSSFTVDAAFRGLEWAPVQKLAQAPGAPPTGVVSVTNRYDTRFSGSVGGSLRGFRRTRTVDVQGDAWTYGFQVDGETRAVEFTFRVPPEAYGTFTDVAITVFDGAGDVVVKDGLVSGRAHVTVPVSAGSYRLELRAAFADSGDVSSTWRFGLDEDLIRKAPIAISGPPATLYPGVAVDVEFELAATPPRVPDGFQTLGEVVLTDGTTREIWASIPITTR